jgi:hypothetical protein
VLAIKTAQKATKARFPPLAKCPILATKGSGTSISIRPAQWLRFT